MSIWAWISQLVVVLKDTAIGYQITFVEMVRQGTAVGSAYGNYIPALIVIALLMISLNFTLSWFATWLERRLRQSRKGREDPKAEEAMEVIAKGATIDHVLHEAATRIVRFFLSDFGQQMFRICVSEAHRFPELGRRFYASGPDLVRERLSKVLRPYVDAGILKIDDMDLAASGYVRDDHLQTYAYVSQNNDGKKNRRVEIFVLPVDAVVAQWNPDINRQ